MKYHSIPELFLAKVNKDPEAIAVSQIHRRKVDTHNNREYLEIVRAIALSLQKLDLQAGDKLAIFANTSRKWHYLDLATIASRCVVVPIYPTYTAEEIAYLLQHSESKVLVIETEQHFKEILKCQEDIPTIKHIIALCPISEKLRQKLRPEIQVHSYEDVITQGKELSLTHENFLQDRCQELDPEEPATIIYTSGTTGLPKGVVLSHRAMITLIYNVQELFSEGFGPQDRTLTFLPLSHVYGRIDSFLNLIFEWHTYYAESISKVTDDILTARPTIMLAVPRIFEKIYVKIKETTQEGSPLKKLLISWALKVSNRYFNKLDEGKTPHAWDAYTQRLAYQLVFSKVYAKFGGAVRYFVSGGAPLSPEIMKFLRNANLTILEGYGLTETMGASFVNPTQKQLPGYVGLPLGDTQVKIAEDGEILIKSQSLFTGYYKNPEETAKAMTAEGWFSTGDIGELNDEGYLKITDRKKDIIVTSGGKNVAPQKIENMMKTQRYIAQFAVVGDKRNFLTGLVGIERERFLQLAHKLDVDEQTPYLELAQNKEIFTLIRQDVNEVNKKLARFETIKKIFIIPEEVSVDTGLLTPSLKIKKKVLFERYQKEIDILYGTNL